MRLINYIYLLTGITTAQSFISTSRITSPPIAQALTKTYPNPSIALLAPPLWWWQSGTVIDGLLQYYHTTSDPKYNDLLINTMISQVTGTNDFMTPDATGNDDQAWWGLAAMSAAEYGLPAANGAIPWIEYARNVFSTQKARWRTDRCNGGLKWKINEGDDGWSYRSTISNGLFFQLAARLARFDNDPDALAWAEKSYDWVSGVGLIDDEFNVFDGTDDSKGTGCVDVNHILWSYNTGAFLYGSAIMADKTGDQKWRDRTSGFLSAAQRNFVEDGALYEVSCEDTNNCNSDQVAFKATLARWMGNAAVVGTPDLRAEISDVLGNAVESVAGGWDPALGAMEHFTALEVVNAALASGDVQSLRTAETKVKRSVAGRISW